MIFKQSDSEFHLQFEKLGLSTPPIGRGEVGITGYQQQTFENNSKRIRTNLDTFIGIFRLPSGNNNER